MTLCKYASLQNSPDLDFFLNKKKRKESKNLSKFIIGLILIDRLIFFKK